MPKTEPETIEKSPTEVPLYTPWDAARYLHLPLWAISTLNGRFRDWREWFFHFHHEFPHSLRFDDDFPPHPEGQSRISFHRLANLFVRAATFQVLAECSRVGVKPSDRWENLYHTIRRGLEDTHRQPVPFDSSPIEERVERLVEPYARRLEEGQSALLRKWFTRRLERVDVTDGVPVRLYPFSRDPAEHSPRIIAIDPHIRFGRPTIADRGVPTDSLFERYQAGDSVAELAEDYGLTTAEVEEAIRYESLSPAPLFPFYG